MHIIRSRVALATLAIFGVVGGAIAALTPRAFADADRDHGTGDNLRQIGIALHNYHDVYNHLPTAAIHGADGRPLLSWRVAILPFLGQNALYAQFRLDEPWDSPNNQKLIVSMPAVFAAEVRNGRPNATYYQGFVGVGAMFDDNLNIRFADVFDGTSNTFMVAEAGKAVLWTAPEDIAFDPNSPLPKLGGVYKDGFNVLFGDGSVRFVERGVPDNVLKKFITRAGGEPIGPNDLNP